MRMIHRHEFLEGTDLQKKVFNIFNSAKREILIISPYIKLYDKVKDQLIRHKDNPKVHLTIMFGKKFKWIKEDIEFIKQFPNVIIKYKENIHIKYYSNEKGAIITSLNLYENSIKNNYETGVYTEYESLTVQFLEKYLITKYLLYIITSPFLLLAWVLIAIATLDTDWDEKDKLASESRKYIDELISNCDSIVYQKKTKINRSIFGNRKTVEESEVLYDKFEESFFQNLGYCIRTGKPIEFNPSQPYSKESFFDWVKEGSNKNQVENFCHRTGKPAEGGTSINNPILFSS